MSLPSGYKLLEYIQSYGNQWIDSGIVPGSSDFSVKSKIRTTAATSAENWFVTIGHSKPSGSATFAQFGTWSSKFAIHLTYVVIDGSTAATSNDVTIDFSISGNTASLSGDASYSVTNANFGSGSFRNQSITICDGLWRTYWSQIKVSGSIVRDYIPCQKPDGTIGLWDDVNSVFYGNAGTGTFTAGPVIAIAANESGITELEYIQSNGTQYINTLFIPKSTSKVVSDFQITEKRSKNNDVFGVVGQFSFRQYANSDFFRTVCGSVADFETSVSILSRHVVEKTMTETKIDGLYSVSTDASTVSNTIFLFAYNAGSYVSNYGYLKLYSCQIYDNGTLIRDYIAAKLSDGAVGLYDKLNSLFYINAGTGTFTAGPNSLNLPVNIGGDWKKANKAFVNIGGTWKTVKDVFVNIDGAWKKIG